MYILDTDHLSVLQRSEQPAVAALSARMRSLGEKSFFVTVITFHEQSMGWNALINRASSIEQTIHGYERQFSMLEEFCRLQVLPFNTEAGRVFMALRAKVRIGTMDLRIAACAIANNMTLLTRNTVDYAKVPDLRYEDWTRTP